jgi:hypothetical protein
LHLLRLLHPLLHLLHLLRLLQVATEKWLLDSGTVRALPRDDAPGSADSEARADADED